MIITITKHINMNLLKIVSEKKTLSQIVEVPESLEHTPQERQSNWFNFNNTIKQYNNYFSTKFDNNTGKYGTILPYMTIIHNIISEIQNISDHKKHTKKNKQDILNYITGDNKIKYDIKLNYIDNIYNIFKENHTLSQNAKEDILSKLLQIQTAIDTKVINKLEKIIEIKSSIENKRKSPQKELQKLTGCISKFILNAYCKFSYQQMCNNISEYVVKDNKNFIINNTVARFSKNIKQNIKNMINFENIEHKSIKDYVNNLINICEQRFLHEISNNTNDIHTFQTVTHVENYKKSNENPEDINEIDIINKKQQELYSQIKKVDNNFLPSEEIINSLQKHMSNIDTDHISQFNKDTIDQIKNLQTHQDIKKMKMEICKSQENIEYVKNTLNINTQKTIEAMRLKEQENINNTSKLHTMFQSYETLKTELDKIKQNNHNNHDEIQNIQKNIDNHKTKFKDICNDNNYNFETILDQVDKLDNKIYDTIQKEQTSTVESPLIKKTKNESSSTPLVAGAAALLTATSTGTIAYSVNNKKHKAIDTGYDNVDEKPTDYTE